MAIFTVENIEDDGSGSLRQAIENANNTPGNDKIRFNKELNGKTIKLTSGELIITDSLQIKGLKTADPLTISGDNNSRIFLIDDFDDENQLEVRFDRLVLTEGISSQGGGAIANSENLAISDSKIVKNENTSQSPTDGGGAIRNSSNGNLNIDRTLISDNISGAFGGGITNFGVLNVKSSIISHNLTTGGGGGGLDNRGIQADITGSIITSNTNTAGPAGGFGNGTAQTSTTVKNSFILDNNAINGAGFFINSGDVKLYNTFVTNNKAQNNGGGIGINPDGNLTVKESIVFSNNAEVNGGGIAILGGSVDLTRSLIIGNTALSGSGGGIFNQGGFFDKSLSLVTDNLPNDIFSTEI